MKNKFCLFVAVAMSSFVHAQDLSYGVKAGLNMSSVDGFSSPKAGFHLGGFVNYSLNDKFSIQPELLYSSENGNYEYSGVLESVGQYNYKQEITTSNISVPVMVNYNLTKKFTLEVGPQVSYLIKANSKNTINFPFNSEFVASDADMNSDSQIVTYSAEGVSDPFLINHDYELNKVNISFNIGGAYQISDALFVQARYNLGLTNFTKNTNFLAGSDSDGFVADIARKGESLKLSGLQVSFGYKF